MYDVSSDSAPPSINDMFILPRKVPKYNTRFSSASNFHTKHSQLNPHKNFFS